MQEGDDNQKHPRPVVDIAEKLPKHNVVFDKQDGLICPRRWGIIMKAQKYARENLKQEDD